MKANDHLRTATRATAFRFGQDRISAGSQPTELPRKYSFGHATYFSPAATSPFASGGNTLLVMGTVFPPGRRPN